MFDHLQYANTDELYLQTASNQIELVVGLRLGTRLRGAPTHYTCHLHISNVLSSSLHTSPRLDEDGSGET